MELNIYVYRQMYVYRFVDNNVRKQKGGYKEDDKKTKT